MILVLKNVCTKINKIEFFTLFPYVKSGIFVDLVNFCMDRLLFTFYNPFNINCSYVLARLIYYIANTSNDIKIFHKYKVLKL